MKKQNQNPNGAGLSRSHDLTGSVRERAIGKSLQVNKRREVAEATDDLVQAKLHKAQLAKEASANQKRIYKLEKFLAQNTEPTLK